MFKDRLLLAALGIPALLLLVPLVAMQFSTEVNWSPLDFVVAYALLAGAGLGLRLLLRHSTSFAFRAGAALAIFGQLSLVWVNLAVGFIGNENNPANLLFLAVLATGVGGVVLGGFAAARLARTCFATAAVQFLVPIVAWLVWRPNFDANVALIFALNFVWVSFFAGAGALFRHAAAAPAPRT